MPCVAGWEDGNREREEEWRVCDFVVVADFGKGYGGFAAEVGHDCGRHFWVLKSGALK